VLAAFDLVDPTEELERIAWGQLVPQLGALAEHRPDVERQLTPLPCRQQSEHVHRPRVRLENARQDLERRRLSRAVRADERDALARRDRERQAVDRRHRVGLREEEIVQARSDAGWPRAAHAKRLAKTVDLDRGCWAHGDSSECRPAEFPEMQNALPETSGRA
jgi:hypothetical protein